MDTIEKAKVWKVIKFSAISISGLFIALIVAGFFTPFDDREAVCSVCGVKRYEKHASWLSESITYTRPTRLRIYYNGNHLPEHEHNWEYMGGVFHTNLYGVPSVYEYERSDPLYAVSQTYLIQILNRLEKRNAKIELLRGINCDDEDLRADVRSHLYEYYPAKIDRFLEWWDVVMTSRQGEVPSEILPGSPWATRMNNSESESTENIDQEFGTTHLLF